ncbi:TonB-dependent siderophore receptor [Cereibacter sphaeroides]|uniref:TonB-dependent siderophore receptor n=1 Tax=Cereibacter sphaeroides TaxID=1063 RepID=UPI001F15C2CF|nr:TonB-dependent siderophore receptor [Cereibacter sphaeroides]MCE6951495.1 TonB-dependent siderophore receptor [Cereibacter sphaeroides]
MASTRPRSPFCQSLRPRPTLVALLLCSAAAVHPGGAAAQEDALALQPITVDGSDDDRNSIVAARNTAGSKTDTDLIDTPASVSVVTAKEIETRGAGTLQQVLSYTAGVSVDEFGSDDRYDYYRIRGFDELALGTYRDGLAVRGEGWTFGRREPYGMERVEVLKGANSALFGLNAPGGLVNAITKQPTSYAFGEVYSTVGEDHAEAGTDFGGPLDEAGVWSYRLTAKWQDADNGGEYSNDDRLYVAPALTWRPSDMTSLTLLADYNRRESSLAYGFPVGVDLDPETFLGEPDFNHFDTVEKNIGWIFEHDFGGGLKLRQNARYTKLDLDYETVYGASTDPAAPRSAFAVMSESEQFAVDTQLQYDASFGRIESRTLAGLDLGWLKVDEEALAGTADGIDIWNPVFCGRGCIALGPYIDWEPEQTGHGIYLQEELTLDDRWILALGGRYDHVDVEIGRPDGTDEATFTDFTRRIGLTYKIDPDLSVYANYSESFQPNLWNIEEDAKEGTQYEIGVKYRPEGLDALFTAAVFDLTQTNVQSYVSPTEQSQIGEVGVRGLELEGKLAMNERLNLTAAYAYWDAEILEDGIGGNAGNRPSRVPDQIISLWADYTLPGAGRRGDMTLGLGLRHVGDSFGDDANTAEVDAHTLVDAAASYGIAPNVDLALNVTNLFDKDYVASEYYGTKYYGDGRKATATLKYRW